MTSKLTNLNDYYDYQKRIDDYYALKNMYTKFRYDAQRTQIASSICNAFAQSSMMSNTFTTSSVVVNVDLQTPVQEAIYQVVLVANNFASFLLHRPAVAGLDALIHLMSVSQCSVVSYR